MLTFILDNVVNQAIVIFFSCFTEKTTGYEFPNTLPLRSTKCNGNSIYILCNLSQVIVGYFDPNCFPLL